MSKLKKGEKSDININDIIQSLYKDQTLKKSFLDFILNLSTKEILWPEKYLEKYPEEFKVKYNDKEYIAYLFYNIHKIEVLEYKTQQWIQHQMGFYEHPYIIYYYIQLFYESLQESSIDESIKKATNEVLNQIKSKKINKLKSGKKHQKLSYTSITKKQELQNEQLQEIEKKIQKIKRVLNVPKKWKQLKSEEIFNELLILFQELSIEKHNLEKNKINLEIELEHFKSPDYINPDIKHQLEQLKQQTIQLNKDLLQERSKNEILEKEVKRLTEQIIENPNIINQQEELENLKKEYALLSEKYDLLVSKNIELRNLLDKQTHVKTLQDALNKIRDRINKVLKTGGLNEEMMIIKIKQEIEELQRSRVYLGKALYDLGLLYLRLGKKEEALRELRAARELGIEDPEVNRLLNSGY